MPKCSVAELVSAYPTSGGLYAPLKAHLRQCLIISDTSQFLDLLPVIGFPPSAGKTRVD
jgi:hypothetical protein